MIKSEPYSEIEFDVVVDMEAFTYWDKFVLWFYWILCFFVGLYVDIEDGEKLSVSSHTWWAEEILKNERRKKFMGEI